MADPVMKEAESRRVIFPPSHVLSPNSAEVTWTLYLDHDSSGASGTSPVPMGGGGFIGGGHLSPGFIPPGPGTIVVVAPPDPEPPVFVYIAVCDTQQHPLDMPGVGPNGLWNSGFFEVCADAFAAASAHQDGAARVDAVTGGVGVSIIGCN